MGLEVATNTIKNVWARIMDKGFNQLNIVIYIYKKNRKWVNNTLGILSFFFFIQDPPISNSHIRLLFNPESSCCQVQIKGSSPNNTFSIYMEDSNMFKRSKFLPLRLTHIDVIGYLAWNGMEAYIKDEIMTKTLIICIWDQLILFMYNEITV